MKKIVSIIVIAFACCLFAEAQELNAKVTVNSDRIQGTNKTVFNTMQSALNEFLNAQRWSQLTIAPNERIDCSFSITIITNPSDNFYTAELLVQARRPVYNSTYVTNILNFRDTQLEFEYMENTPIEYIGNSIDNNLIAVVAFYANLILGLDSDSFSPMGGSPFFRRAQSIVTQAQSYSAWTGWAAFDKNNNRHGIINAFTDESLSAYRELWYTYHRKGLDEMAANPDRGRANILAAIPALDGLRGNRSSMVIIQMFADSKLDELVALSNKATAEEKKAEYDLLRKVYPTMSPQLEPLKK